MTDEFAVQTGILQGLPISPILYLFYNADLLEICERPGTNSSALGFVDDTNILAYSTSTEENCRILENLHKKCEHWAKHHGAIFAPKKYHLIHLAKNPRNFNIAAAIKIDCSENSAIINPETNIQILGLQIDTKLQWGLHIKGIQKKMTKQSLALSRISTLT